MNLRRGLAATAFLALVLTSAGCGASTGVQSGAAMPVVHVSEHAVRIWFIRPGGRVGVARDLVPVTIRVRGYPDQVPKLTLLALERGPTPALTRAGYHSVVGCCTQVRVDSDGLALVPHPAYAPSVVATGKSSTWPWIVLAGTLQVQRTLAGLSSIHGVEVGDSQQTYAVQRYVEQQLARGRDPGETRPVTRASCAVARSHGTGAAISVMHTATADARVRVRAPVPVSIEISERFPSRVTSIVAATAMPCGVADVNFPRPGELELFAGSTTFQVRVTPLAGSPIPGVIRRFVLNFPKPVTTDSG